jgi:NAD-dependent SIR2 family protein deacetylase
MGSFLPVQSVPAQAEEVAVCNQGVFRPDIILYDEPDPRADTIAEIIQHDMQVDIDLILILGTSLTVHGIQNSRKALLSSPTRITATYCS